jgi:hypothetical protein
MLKKSTVMKEILGRQKLTAISRSDVPGSLLNISAIIVRELWWMKQE